MKQQIYAKKLFKYTPIKIVLYYFIISALWIYTSDTIVLGFAPEETLLTRIQTYKGWFFIFITSAFLYIIIYSYMKKIRLSSEALIAIESQYRILFNDNPLPMWIYDTTTLKFLEVNNAAVLCYGYSKEEFLNMSIKELRPENEGFPLIEFLELDKQKYRKIRPVKQIKKDGSPIYVEIVSIAIDFMNLQARLVLSKDITETNDTLRH